jgi:hypothetical protein
METTMKRSMKSGLIAAMVAVLGAAAAMAVVADGAAPIGAFWQVGKDAGKVEIVMPGAAAPVTTTVSDTTIFAGICLDCMLPLEFKPAQTGKNCAVCGCAVSNAQCIVGKPVKEGTWQAMLKALPHGVGLVPTYVEAGKPESGLKKLVVNLRAVILPVSGLDGQSADQLLALAKPIGATKAELVDGGKILSITLKTDYTHDKAAKLEKAIAGANGKIGAPEAPKAE